jgi:hypothetical protein
MLSRFSSYLEEKNQFLEILSNSVISHLLLLKRINSILLILKISIFHFYCSLTQLYLHINFNILTFKIDMFKCWTRIQVWW